MPGRGRTFSYEEALETFPRVRDLTGDAVRQIEALYSGVRGREELDDRRDELEETANGIIRAWADAITALGCEVKGLWLVDWDCGGGYYCWRYPEASIGWFHTYEEGFRGRVPVN